MKNRPITIEGAVDALSERIARCVSAPVQRNEEQLLCLLFADGSHYFIASRAGRADAESRIPFNRRDYVQASFTSARLPCAYYFTEN